MTPDLTYLTWAAALCAVVWIPYILARIMVWGLPQAMGYPESPPALPNWAQRSTRAHLNLVENLAPFAALVLVAHVTGLANETTAMGAAVFFWARVVQWIAHVLGVPYVRTVAFAVSLIGMALIFIAIVGGGTSAM